MQVSKFGSVTNLATENFALADSQPFIVKNDNAAVVTLQVLPLHGTGSEWVSTKFYLGWNPEIILAIKKNAGGGTLLWGL